MNMTIVNRASRVLLASLGFGATWLAAVNADRLTAEGVDAGPADYLLRVLLPLALCAGLLIARIVLRAREPRSAISTNSPLAPHLTALGTEIGKLTAEGNIAGAKAVLTAAESVKGGTGS
jgi:Flp pilus assembly protein protease CpaA